VIQENLGRRTPSRTLQDLLTNEHDAALFEHHLQSQVVAVSLDGSVRNVGAPGMIVRSEPSPDGQYLLVETVRRPFSYIVPESRFPLDQALKGLGGTARLVMLPHEAHGYRARESVLHMLWETDRWLETYVKNAKPRQAAK
jgi:hypothetical protein